MIQDAGLSISPGAELNADVCIIGSGAAAISLAHRLIPSNQKIVVLESSRSNPVPRGFPPDGLGLNTFAVSDNQALYCGTVSEPLATIDPSFLTRSRRLAYGGSTNCWGGTTRPLDAIDFDRSDLGALFQWPFQRDELVGFYNDAIKYCSLGRWDVSAYDDLESWRDKTIQELAQLTFEPDSLARVGVLVTMPVGGVGGGRLAFQAAWGPVLEEASNVHIYRNAHARFLEGGPGNTSVRRLLVSSVFQGHHGFDFAIKSRFYVLAAGGIENARLLLISDGLGNQNDNVGRYFMLHPVNETAARYTVGPRWGQSPAAPCLRSLTKQHTWPSAIEPIVMPTPKAMTTMGIGGCRIRFNPNRFISFTWEQAPNRANRVTLNGDRDPIFCDPQVQIDWTLFDQDLKTMHAGLVLLLNEMSRSGYFSGFSVLGDRFHSGDHHMGSTRMSAAANDGVVDSDCRIHGVDNVFIAGSSVFATGGFAHPTLTIIALALRLADHLMSQKTPTTTFPTHATHDLVRHC